MASRRLPGPVQSAPVAGPRWASRPMGKFAFGWGGAEGRVAGQTRFAHGPREGRGGLAPELHAGPGRGLHAGPGRGPPPHRPKLRLRGPLTPPRPGDAAPRAPRDPGTPVWGRGPRCGAAQAALQVGLGRGRGRGVQRSGPGLVRGQRSGTGSRLRASRGRGLGGLLSGQSKSGRVSRPGKEPGSAPPAPRRRCGARDPGPRGRVPLCAASGPWPIGPGRPAPRAPAETRPEPAALTALRDAGTLQLGSAATETFQAPEGRRGRGTFLGRRATGTRWGHGGAKGMSLLPLLPPPRGPGKGCRLESLPGALNGAAVTRDPPVPPLLSPLGGTPGPWQRWVLPIRGGSQPGFAEVWLQGRQPEIPSLPILIFN